MAKSILISIKPRYVADILNHKKTIEVRKSMPKCDLPIDVYIYCTKDSSELLHKNCADIFWVEDKEFQNKNKKLGIKSSNSLNGKIIAKFTLNKVEKLFCAGQFYSEEKQGIELLEKSCLSSDEFDNYRNDKVAYAWYIDDLVFFDKPKELSEFGVCTEKTCIYGKCHKYMHCLKTLTKAPQSWQFIEVDK